MKTGHALHMGSGTLYFIQRTYFPHDTTLYNRDGAM